MCVQLEQAHCTGGAHSVRAHCKHLDRTKKARRHLPTSMIGAQKNWKGASLPIFAVQQPPMPNGKAPWNYFRHLKHENVIPFQAQRFKLKSGEKKPRPGLVFLLAVAESHPCCHTLFWRCCYSLALQDWAKISSSRDGAQKDNARCSEGLKV